MNPALDESAKPLAAGLLRVNTNHSGVYLRLHRCLSTRRNQCLPDSAGYAYRVFEYLSQRTQRQTPQ